MSLVKSKKKKFPLVCGVILLIAGIVVGILGILVGVSVIGEGEVGEIVAGGLVVSIVGFSGGSIAFIAAFGARRNDY